MYLFQTIARQIGIDCFQPLLGTPNSDKYKIVVWLFSLKGYIENLFLYHGCMPICNDIMIKEQNFATRRQCICMYFTFEVFIKLLSFVQNITTECNIRYHNQINREMERFYQTLKYALIQVVSKRTWPAPLFDEAKLSVHVPIERM